MKRLLRRRLIPAPNGTAAAVLALLGASPSCALPPSEIHLAPLFSVHRTAGGGREVEALAGIFRWKRDAAGSEWAARPLVRRFEKGERSGWDFLYPLGVARSTGEEKFVYLFPLGWWRRWKDAQGRPATDGGLLPVFFAGRTGEGKAWFGIFPFFGTWRGFFTVDELRWVLFPLYVETRKEGGWRTRSLVWPVFAYGEKGDGRSYRAWPLLGWTRAGENGRWFALWPLFHGTSGERSSFLAAPLYGKSRRGDETSTTLLWPFFGWTHNAKTGFLAVEAPWPLVRIVRGAKGGRFRATRMLPFYAGTSTPSLSSRAFLWPLVWVRRESGEGYTRASLYVLPFLVRTRLERKDGARETLTHLWPLFHRESRGEETALRVPTLLPLPRLRGFAENWESLLALYERRATSARKSERGFADLWRREEDEGESRWSIPLLLASRRGSDGTREWSAFAGLLRFRAGPGGVSLLAPAFPGPGFE